jgi:hypothetical protein
MGVGGAGPSHPVATQELSPTWQEEEGMGTFIFTSVKPKKMIWMACRGNKLQHDGIEGIRKIVMTGGNCNGS